MLVRTLHSEEKMNTLIMFHGQECPHCQRMFPLVDQLEQETGLTVERLEVWHNDKNADLMRSKKDVITPHCGGQLRVPTFLNSETSEVICGEVEYNKLKSWATK